jgi:uncharacterized membrane protein
VLFLMLANHYPLAFASRWNWIIVALAMLAGGVIRHFYSAATPAAARPGGPGPSPRRPMALAAWLAIAGAPGLSPEGQRPAPCLARPASPAPASPSPAFAAAVEAIRTAARCAMRPNRCGTASPAPRRCGWRARPTSPAMPMPSASRRYLSHAMPPNNITEMTAGERRAAAWLMQKPVFANGKP